MPRHPDRCYPDAQWRWKRLISRHIAATEPPRFANEAELEYAKILDYYGIPWLYEPHTFVLERDEEGRVIEAFTPDFYLPEQDLYLEVTVMKQSLVTRKNRKLRKLRQLYPEVRIKLFYERDFERLAARYGLREGILSAAAPSVDDAASARSTSTPTRSRARVRELGAEIARDYAGREPLLVGSLKACVPFVCRPLARDPDPHALDFVELAGYGGRDGRPRGDPLPEGPRRRDRGPRRRSSSTRSSTPG